ncbi:MAG: glycine cleavage system aminomethyltransferase GcvT [Anaerolineae bacterium]
MGDLNRTVFYEHHVALGARMIEFAGWEMPVWYTGVVEEHLATRKNAGLFDVSHMGRFVVRGAGALPFLQHVLTNNVEALDIRTVGAQYTLLANESGGAIDDAFLYRFVEDEYLLVVNASNSQKDWAHLQSFLPRFPDVELLDRSQEIAMLALQGPRSRDLLAGMVEGGTLPEPMRNAVSIATIGGARALVARTGYTGEPICFELFVDGPEGPRLWERLVAAGATPVGLAARDSLRLEAALPLYGHELGADAEGKEIPMVAVPQVKLGLSFSPLKGDFIGRAALARQWEALNRIKAGDFTMAHVLPRLVWPVALAGKGLARGGAKVFQGDRHVGYVTSGTMLPMWVVEGEGLTSAPSDRQELRSVCLAYIDCHIKEGEAVSVDYRGRLMPGVVVPYHMRSDAPPYVRPIVYDHKITSEPAPVGSPQVLVRRLLERTVENTLWRQRACMNLIPSEMTPSPMARLASIMDPAFRYAEHRKVDAFHGADVFYYQGTEFIAEVERLLIAEMKRYLGCPEVETRLISGQMANTAVFSALVDYLNRADRRSEPRRIRRVLNNHISKGGHLSAQPMGALKDFVARDPRTERPAVTAFPVLAENPYRTDVPATLKLIDQYRPELIIFGKSMVLHKEPVAEIRQFLDEQAIDAVVMYDMAHVLGLIGPHFQQPFAEGADLVTGSTHKTFFGTQRGIVGGRYQEPEERYELWKAIYRRAFPGSVSNHHLGTLLGLLIAAYEMNHFRDVYQAQVIANAKAFARALKETGLDVAGDPTIGYTETHQVVVRVGYARGPEMAERLEANNIICNYQAGPEEESFTAAGSLRLGVAEMTRFGMRPDDFRALAGLIADVVIKGAHVASEVTRLRERFLELQFCFSGSEYAGVMEELHRLV